MKVDIDKDVLLKLLVSHSRLAQAEFNRNPGYNNEHFSYIAEDQMASELSRLNLMDELFALM